MEHDEHLLIFGASARAAAFSALRANLRPWCADLFADADLQGRCPCLRIRPGAYPRGFLKVARRAPPGPWMYTGGLENRPRLVEQIGRGRRLWGAGPATLRLVRSPPALHALFSTAGLPCPALHLNVNQVPRAGRWLVKPWHGAGGSHIRFWRGEPLGERQHVYFQEYVEGEACSALYVGDEQGSQLLGVTRQLVGESWLHAAPFRYCGSVGPLAVAGRERQAFQDLGMALAGCGLRGLFGVDCVLREGVPWPVEVNPRYPASAEVLEHGAGVSVIALHQQAFEPDCCQVPRGLARPSRGIGGKAILFAQVPVVFPASGPWLPALQTAMALDEMPAFADIPRAGERIERGRPILTCFASAETVAACVEELRQIAADLDLWLGNR